MKDKVRRYAKATLIGIAIFGVFGFTIYQFYKQAWISTDRIMAEHIEQLSSIFKSIDETAGIASISHDRNYIDFLNVRSFSGSEVGSLNLVRPAQWKGPYLMSNLTMQGKLYEIVKTKEGYYIVPGDGVRLSNKKVIGKDIKFTADSDIEAFVNNKVGLEFDGRPLAVRLHLKSLGIVKQQEVFNQPGFQQEE